MLSGHRVPGRDLSRVAKLRRASFREPDRLERGRQGRSLCRIGAIASLHRRDARGVQLAAQAGVGVRRAQRVPVVPHGFGTSMEGSHHEGKTASPHRAPRHHDRGFHLSLCKGQERVAIARSRDRVAQRASPSRTDCSRSSFSILAWKSIRLPSASVKRNLFQLIYGFADGD
jgi:hypothetical protein